MFILTWLQLFEITYQNNLFEESHGFDPNPTARWVLFWQQWGQGAPLL